MVSATSAAVESVEGLLTPRFLRIFTSTQQLPLNSFWFSRGVRSEGPVPSQSGARARHRHARRRPWLPRVEVPRPPPRPRPNQWCVRTPPARSRRPSAPTLNQTWHRPPVSGGRISSSTIASRARSGHPVTARRVRRRLGRRRVSAFSRFAPMPSSSHRFRESPRPRSSASPRAVGKKRASVVGRPRARRVFSTSPPRLVRPG